MATRRPPPSRCANHEDRSAFAVCMECRKTLCQECATTWDGIHYCAACLAAVRETRREASSRWATAFLLLVAGALFWVHLKLQVWSGVLVAGWR